MAVLHGLLSTGVLQAEDLAFLIFGRWMLAAPLVGLPLLHLAEQAQLPRTLRTLAWAGPTALLLVAGPLLPLVLGLHGLPNVLRETAGLWLIPLMLVLVGAWSLLGLRGALELVHTWGRPPSLAIATFSLWLSAPIPALVLGVGESLDVGLLWAGLLALGLSLAGQGGAIAVARRRGWGVGARIVAAVVLVGALGLSLFLASNALR